MLTTSQKGAIAETAIVHAATCLGIGVLKPVSEGARYDVLFDLGTRFVRVQCKTAKQRRNVLVIPFCSARRTPRGFEKRSYTSAEIDAVAAYSPELRRSYLLPLNQFSVVRTCSFGLPRRVTTSNRACTGRPTTNSRL
jgi:hypothetical protein